MSVMLEDVATAKQDGITAVETLPSMPQNIGRKPKLPKQSVTEKHRSRMF